jgi:rhodanese-related sulfurtransferase
MNTEPAITSLELTQRLADFPPPTLVDARRDDAFARDRDVIPGALKRDPAAVAQWAADLDPWRPVVVYCVRGHEVSRDTAHALRERGFDAAPLAGGLEAWRASGGGVAPFAEATRWVTRARPKIDRIACPWLVRRFVDPGARFFYVPANEVRGFATAHEATPFDIAGVEYGHSDDRCSFDAFIRIHRLRDDALGRLAQIVRAADTDTLALSAQAPGLLATSQGLSALFADDHAMLRAGMMMYDALYLWCRAQSKMQSTPLAA